MKPMVDWIKVDLSMKKSELPAPLSCQSGGKFWVCLDGGIHGRSLSLCHWTGTKFTDINNDRITHFAKVEWPDYPE